MDENPSAISSDLEMASWQHFLNADSSIVDPVPTENATVEPGKMNRSNLHVLYIFNLNPTPVVL